MKISCIKYYKDNRSFNVIKNFGVEVNDIIDVEEIDNKIKELVDKKYNTIMITNELAFFSGDIIKKYSNSEDVKIIITNNKTKHE